MITELIFLFLFFSMTQVAGRFISDGIYRIFDKRKLKRTIKALDEFKKRYKEDEEFES